MRLLEEADFITYDLALYDESREGFDYMIVPDGTERNVDSHNPYFTMKMISGKSIELNMFLILGLSMEMALVLVVMVSKRV